MSDLSALNAYIPLDRRLALVRGEKLPERTVGAALFADVSGFTALTAVLMQELGPERGAEEVLNYLNPVFEALVERLHEYGGVVLGFAGDSITSWLDGDDGCRALACAQAMQEVMVPYRQMETRAGTRFSLQIKVAITAGEARRFIVGDPDIQLLDVLAGQTVMRMAAIEQLARPGETLVEASVWRTLQHKDVCGPVAIGEWRRTGGGVRAGLVTAIGKTVPPAPALETEGILEEQVVRRWLLPPVYQRIQAGQGFLGELRPAVALFMRFTGLDYDHDEAVVEKLDTFVRWVEQVAARHDGYLIQLTVGDKGSFLYLAFGAPIAHGNNAVRAVATALELAQRATTFAGIAHVQIGMSAGRMWTGAYGGRRRSTYGVMGNETNMAARLMSKAAPGQILVTAQVVEAADQAFRFRSVGNLEVKGRVEPLPAWEATGERVAGGKWLTATTPLVGRHDAFSRLERALKQARTGEGRIICLAGAAGIGKSHLVVHFAQHSAGQGARVGLGTAESVTRYDAYRPWRQIFEALLGPVWPGPTKPEALLDRLVNAYPQWALRLPLLGDLLGVPLPDNQTTATFDAALRQKSLQSLVVDMVRAWAETRPLVLILEDAHWLDEASLSLTEAVARQAVPGSRLLLLLVQRDEGAGKHVLPALATLAHYDHLQLGEMAVQDVALLVDNLLEAPPAPLLSSLLQQLARGNPFFTAELLELLREEGRIMMQQGVWNLSDETIRMLHTAGALQQEEGEWHLRPGAQLTGLNLGVPDSIHGLVLSRLDRLPEQDKLLLKVGSVIGQSFALRLVAKADPIQRTPAELSVTAEELSEAHILFADEPASSRYNFRHHVTHEVAYETLLYTQRQQLHRTVAGTLAAEQPQEAFQIAHHAFMGQDWALAFSYNLSAGEQARQLFANRQSIEFYRRALQSASALPEDVGRVQRLQLYLGLGEVLVSTGGYEEATGQLESALRLAALLADGSAQARACRWLGRAHEQRGEYGPALDWLEQGLAAVQDEASIEEAEIALIAGLIHLRQGSYEQTLAFCQRSLQVAETLGDGSVSARAYNLMGLVDQRRGMVETAVGRFQQSLDRYQQLGNVYGQATSHNLIANGLYAEGRWTAALGHYRRALAMFAEMGDVYNQVLVNNNLGGIALKQGQLAAAFAYYEKAIRLLEQIGGSLWVFGALHMNSAHALLQQRALAAAAERLQVAQDYFEQAQSRDLLPELHGLLAETALLMGNLEQASVEGEHALALARELEMPREEGRNLRIMGEIARARGQPARAEQYYLDSCRQAGTVGDVYEEAKAQLALASLYAAEARNEEAVGLLSQSEETFTRLGAALDLESVREVYGRLQGNRYREDTL